MRYAAEPKYRKYAKGYAFCHLQEHFEINIVNNWWILPKKTGIDAGKTVSKNLI